MQLRISLHHDASDTKVLNVKKFDFFTTIDNIIAKHCNNDFIVTNFKYNDTIR